VLTRSSFIKIRMLLPELDEKGCEVVNNKINNTFNALGFSFRGEIISITTTISAVTH
jgi:hypothetical protein